MHNARAPSSYSFLEFSRRVRRLVGDDNTMCHEAMTSIISLALYLDETRPLHDAQRTTSRDELRAIVSTATQSDVHTVTFVRPEDLPPHMALWPTHGSLWPMGSLVGTYLALQHAGSTRIAELTELVEGYLGDRAATGLHRNFHELSPEQRKVLHHSFGWSAGNTAMNRLALALAGEQSRAAAVAPLMLQLLSTPFMARHPLRTSELIVLVRAS